MQIEELLKQNSKQIKDYISTISIQDYPFYIKHLSISDKKTIQNIAISMSKKLDKLEDEKNRIKKMYQYEQDLKDRENIKNILCLDEVGRGPLAGPVVVCGVMLDDNPNILYINDSKKLSEEKRQEIFENVIQKNINYKIQTLDNQYIDEFNIFNATYMAMSKLANEFDKKIEHILIDGNQILKDVQIDQTAVIKGDLKVLGIAIASIIAKVTRDDMMKKYDKIYPQYNFAKNKGYGTSEHIDAIKKYGLCPIHRKSFLKNICPELL